MQIQIRLPAEVGPSLDPLPPALAKISANETVIIELQGSIQIEGEKSGELIGNLDVTNIVCVFFDAFPPRRKCIKENRSEEHTSELQSLTNLVCRLLLEKK